MLAHGTRHYLMPDTQTCIGTRTAKSCRKAADTAKMNWLMAELILVIMITYAAMAYGPIAAFLVELFPTRIRYTSISLPYHIGAGWFGGMLPARNRYSGRNRKYLQRPLVSNQSGRHDGRSRRVAAARHQGRRHQIRLGRRSIAPRLNKQVFAVALEWRRNSRRLPLLRRVGRLWPTT